MYLLDIVHSALPFLWPFSALHDAAYSCQNGLLRSALHVLNCNSRRVIRQFTRSLSGAWPGNDTCWRMALDLARIVEYANKNGELCPEKRRVHVMVTDGVIGGEGDGPLSPRAVPMGYLSFAENAALGDYVNSLAIGFDPEKIPLISEAFRVKSYPLADRAMLECGLRINGERFEPLRLWKGLGRDFMAPRAWRGLL